MKIDFALLPTIVHSHPLPLMGFPRWLTPSCASLHTSWILIAPYPAFGVSSLLSTTCEILKIAESADNSPRARVRGYEKPRALREALRRQEPKKGNPISGRRREHALVGKSAETIFESFSSSSLGGHLGLKT